MISQLDSYKLEVWNCISAHPLSANTRISCIIKWINWENLNMFVRQHQRCAATMLNLYVYMAARKGTIPYMARNASQ